MDLQRTGFDFLEQLLVVLGHGLLLAQERLAQGVQVCVLLAQGSVLFEQRAHQFGRLVGRQFGERRRAQGGVVDGVLVAPRVRPERLVQVDQVAQVCVLVQQRRHLPLQAQDQRLPRVLINFRFFFIF